jgi:lipopolysaccharide export system protein LptC
MKRTRWVILIIALIIYSIVVWSWIQEGNRRFDNTDNLQAVEPIL